MYRTHFITLSIIILSLLAVATIYWPPSLYLLILGVALTIVGVRDLSSSTNVLNNYPVIGHLRYLLEFIRPELRQYFFESEFSGRPFNRMQRTLIEHRAANKSDASPFGTLYDFDAPGFNYAEHSLAPKEVPSEVLRIKVGGPQCSQPYLASRLNISAMSFGALSAPAVSALNLGAARGGFAHNTGEGSISPYHLEHNGDLIWQIGTAYFGCRTPEGRFSPDLFAEKAQLKQVKMIELKLSQGAKPAHGGLLLASKITPEIADTRLIQLGKDCVSPPSHSEFSTPIGLLKFVEQLRALSGGKPVGFKMCLGKRSEFLSICKAMLETGILPDFITIDGAEGGTGAAPQEFSDSLGNYINEALPFVNQCLIGVGLREHIRLIASGKVALGFDLVLKSALGADMFNAARPFMFSLGCIQARRCHTNECPTGVTTQDPSRNKAIKVDEKGIAVSHYHTNTLNAFRELVGAMGLDHPDKLTPAMIYHRQEYARAQPFILSVDTLLPKQLLGEDIPASYAELWQAASAEQF
ncbi:FMN-binding glutamate synthase family protein [Oceanisphaera avium]|uniref:FMN-binding glutamate synthase family protein n=1 Tax=Oceanisphaera avium TaxID=1903694 RepID=A0A1Y0CWN2_9GAMM|nr:FMN-binding glutamate synthase family protein [Oceanisphaera avium]ART79297.1 FMN-binding glutamate synthase family protein [Oceanisphaera avium]